MTFLMMSAAVTLAAFAAMTAIGSAIVNLLAPSIARRCEQYSPAACAARLFRLRLLPGGLAAFAAFAFVLPVFAAYEPRATSERVPLVAALLAGVGAALLIRGLWRAVAAWHATRAVVRDWRDRGRPLAVFDTPLPVFAIEEPFPTVAVVGIVRPALYIAERVLRECPDDEIRAMLHHECAHVAKRDNLKRLIMRACPDFLGRDLERAWARAAEEAADAAVVAGHPRRAVALAQALIHIARLAPRPETPALVSAFYLGGSIESRVRRLIQPCPAPDTYPRPRRLVAAVVTLASAGALLAIAPGIHRAVEVLVNALP